MNRLIIILFAFALFSCNKQTKPVNEDLVRFDPFPLEVPEQNSLLAGWEEKPVLDTKLIEDMEDDSDWIVTGIGEMSYTEERSKDGKRSLRFRTSLRDEEHYRRNRSKWDSFEAGQGGSSSVRLRFSQPQDWSDYNRLSFWVYVHPTSMPNYSFNIGIQNEGYIPSPTKSRTSHFIHDLKPGEWNHILFEIPHLERDKVNQFTIHQTLRGHNPEEEGIVTYDIDKIELQRVDTDQYEGWTVAPGKFSFSHAGYRPSDSKIAMAGEGVGSDFQLIDNNDKIVLSGSVKTISNLNGKFNIIDFSDLKTEGLYRIKTGTLVSNPFPVDENIWLQPVFKSINFYYCLRCGFHVPGVHTECHKDWQGFLGDKKKIINGGWHDAGDLSQGYWRTAMAAYTMLNNLEALNGKAVAAELSQRIRSELAWGVEWLLKTRFGNGYHMSWGLMRIYTDNEIGTIDDVLSQAANVPWENFLAAAVLSRTSQILADSHPELAGKAKTAALEDWEAAVASTNDLDQLDYKEASWGVTSSLLLARMTGESKYTDQAVSLAKHLLQCQEQSFKDNIPITGYFYTNTSRKSVIHNYHAAFEEAPLIALNMLCRELPGHDDWIKWYSAAVLHSEFFMKRGSRIAAPYDLLPNSVWKKEEIMAEKDEQLRESLLEQFNDGTHLNNDYVLRTFPIYFNNLFHGNTNIHLSSTWALAEASSLRNDHEGMKLVEKQLQWVLGANPFGQSLMYGAGYDFAPHFAYCLKNVVGSLPVGMDCMSGDEPHWSATNDATYKEIWTEPSSRFMGAVSVYTSADKTNSPAKRQDLEISAESARNEDGSVKLRITLAGKGKHNITIKAFNAITDFEGQDVDLSDSGTEIINLVLTIPDRNKPYVAVVSATDNPDLRAEIVGAFIDAPF